MISNFNFLLIDKFIGYNSSADKTNTDPRFLIRGSKNVYIKESGTVAVRPGLKRRGSADTSEVGILSSFVWESSAGVEKPLRVSNGKLQVESDIVSSGAYVWYDLMTSLTKTRFVFDTWWDNTAKRDVLLFVKGDNNVHKWSGGIGLIVGTTVNTITLNANAAPLGFETSGSVIINGTTYTYSGISGAQLTGVGTDPTGEVNGSVVISAVVTTASKPEANFICDFIKVNNNQVAIGSYSSRVIWISDDEDYTNFTVPGTRAPGDPEMLTFDNLTRGIGVAENAIYVTAGSRDWYKVTFNQITVGTTLTEQTVVDKLETSNLEAALAHEYITNIGDAIAYLSRGQELKILGTFVNLSKPTFATLSLPIKQELENETFSPIQGETSDGELVSIGNKLYLTSVSGGTTYVHETRQAIDEKGQVVADRFWHPPQIWGISRVVVIGGVEYGHSVANPQLYQLWNTEQWHDDSPVLSADEENYEELPYDAVMRMAYRGMGETKNGNRAGLLNMDMAYFEGYAPQGTQLKGRFYADYQGSTSLQELTLNSTVLPAVFFTGFSSPGMGDASLGENPLGEGLTEEELSQEQIPKFRDIAGLGVIDCFEYCLEVYSETVDSRWEILALGTNAMESSRKATFIR